jgi:NADPH:quinone reductase-like Zn-dependent oxidoreductase
MVMPSLPGPTQNADDTSRTKVLILGGSGMLGHKLWQVLAVEGAQGVIRDRSVDTERLCRSRFCSTGYV